MLENELLEIDGSVMEGGGQILRISISLSAILEIPVKVSKIRAGRSKPGLAMQHLKGLELVAEMCGGKLSGARLGSTEIEFRPNKLKGGNFIADTKTAGSVSLLLQVALPCALLSDSPVSLELKGGTNADMAPVVDYMIDVFLPTLRKFGGDFDLNILKRGFYPKGGGVVRVLVNPVRGFKSVDITARGTVTNIQGWSFATASWPITVAQQMCEAAKQELRSEGEPHIEFYKEQPNFAPGFGACIFVKCETSSGCVLGADALGKGPRDGLVHGSRAGRALLQHIRSGACLDIHAQDQVIVYMALAEGRSVVRVGEITLHTQTAIYIAELIAKVKFEIKPDGNQNLIECTGLGVINNKR